MPKSDKSKAIEFSKYFLAKKTFYGPTKKEPVWVYLEREMQANIDKKPYNKKVGDWLKFMRDLRRYFYLESKKQERILKKEIGPIWYVEMSGFQKEVLRHLIKDIHYDLIENLPTRTRKSLSDLGISRSIPKSILLKAMNEAGGDAAVFIWKLYTAIYNKTPSEPRGEYDMDAMILMSALTFIDLDECIENLKDLTKPVKETPEPVTKKAVKKDSKHTDNRYGMYLERSTIPVYCRHPSPQRGQRVKKPPPRMEKKITIRSDDSYERLRLDNTFVSTKSSFSNCRRKHKFNLCSLSVSCLQKATCIILFSNFVVTSFLPSNGLPVGFYVLKMYKTLHLFLLTYQLERRQQRCVKAKQAERICTYKFWEPPVYLRTTNPGMTEYYEKLKLLQKAAQVQHMTPLNNVQFNVGTVALIGGKPRYLLNNIALLPTGYIAINGGTTTFSTGEYLTVIIGHWRYPVEKEEKCDVTCDCIKWESAVIKHLEESKCKCGHLYDFYLEGKSKEKYFYQPTKQWPLWFDEAKIFQMDPMEDFIKDTVRIAERSQEPTPIPSHPELSAGGVKTKALLQSFLADLSGTPLVIPHLPQAELLNNLQELVRKRFNGDLSPEAHKLSVVRSLRRWLWLKHMDFRERAYMIPFTKHELENITWADRQNLQYLFETLLRDFTARNRLRQLEQTRLWWSTMKFDRYPSQAFLDLYFTYMPGRSKDTYIFNPFNAELTPNDIYKTCPLS
ncbi:uncharacterized protein LOC133533299 [Cydia pomonella]|uniref:uncharacterized protein LOC133533299 n=1 Tax=Cydia pomonella TaxID=82600 RepID=UPI002ADE5827|nr:uncharacterized protein LOC133533299 [Cydia pomonella]